MGHIINIVNFLLEITFGRQPSRKNGKRTILFLVVTVILAGSLAGNVLFFREIYDLTAKDIANRRELARLLTIEKERDEFRSKYLALTELLRDAPDLPTTAQVAKPAEKPAPQRKMRRGLNLAHPGPERPTAAKKAEVSTTDDPP